MPTLTYAFVASAAGPAAAESWWPALFVATVVLVLAVATASALARSGWLALRPTRYLAHLAFLVTVSAVPLYHEGVAAPGRVAAVAIAVAVLWLASLAVVSRIERRGHLRRAP